MARWLTALVNSVWKGPNWNNFQKLECNWHFFKTEFLFDTQPQTEYYTINYTLTNIFHHWKFVTHFRSKTQNGPNLHDLPFPTTIKVINFWQFSLKIFKWFLILKNKKKII